ncbi:MAG: hypothetical protein GX097_02615, partial [Methanomicrobiales archaeon]|nr:hypothetical protein [Methanomicrobiales archaeon]
MHKQNHHSNENQAELSVETALIIAGISLATTMSIFLFAKGWLKLIPIL